MIPTANFVTSYHVRNGQKGNRRVRNTAIVHTGLAALAQSNLQNCIFLVSHFNAMTKFYLRETTPNRSDNCHLFGFSWGSQYQTHVEFYRGSTTRVTMNKSLLDSPWMNLLTRYSVHAIAVARMVLKDALMCMPRKRRGRKRTGTVLNATRVKKLSCEILLVLECTEIHRRIST